MIPTTDAHGRSTSVPLGQDALEAVVLARMASLADELSMPEAVGRRIRSGRPYSREMTESGFYTMLDCDGLPEIATGSGLELRLSVFANIPGALTMADFIYHPGDGKDELEGLVYDGGWPSDVRGAVLIEEKNVV